MNDIELTYKALLACGYVAKIRTVRETKMVYVDKVYWHPLTNIHQAMELLIAAPAVTVVSVGQGGVACSGATVVPERLGAATMIAAQCRAIVGACAALYDGVQSART